MDEIHFFKKENGEYNWKSTIIWQAMLKDPEFRKKLMEKIKKQKNN